jgi:hypothetical protein
MAPIPAMVQTSPAPTCTDKDDDTSVGHDVVIVDSTQALDQESGTAVRQSEL